MIYLKQLRKWTTGPSYRSRFVRAFSSVVGEYQPSVSANIFSRKNSTKIKQALLNSYNYHIGGVEGRGIGFEECLDSRGRNQMKHSFVNFFGYHEIQCPENQNVSVIVNMWLLLTNMFPQKNIVDSGKLGFDNLALRLVSDN